MNRYYYDCPLKAAWMAKYFGMKFNGCFVPDSDIAMIRWANKLCVVDKIYIHPDSLYLLEPQVDDLGFSIKGDVIRYTHNHYYNRNEWWFIDEKIYDRTCECAVSKKIIQRNNIAFMWPGGEE